jgi:hypothetical protein
MQKHILLLLLMQKTSTAAAIAKAKTFTAAAIIDAKTRTAAAIATATSTAASATTGISTAHSLLPGPKVARCFFMKPVQGVHAQDGRDHMGVHPKGVQHVLQQLHVVEESPRKDLVLVSAGRGWAVFTAKKNGNSNL